MRVWKTTLGALAALAITTAGAGCDNTNSSGTGLASTVTPSTTVTETFTGTVGPKGAVTYQFVAGAAGTVTAAYTAISPNTTQVLGLALGSWNGSSCGLVVTNDAATANVTVTGATSGAGNLCVRVYDVGKVTETQTFTVQITHQ